MTDLNTDDILLFIYCTNQHIGMIYEGSCDTDDWSNATENLSFHHKNKLHFKMYTITKLIF